MSETILECQKLLWDHSFITLGKFFEKVTFLPADLHTNGFLWMETSIGFHENLKFRSLYIILSILNKYMPN